jgi:hypothetical protein
MRLVRPGRSRSKTTRFTLESGKVYADYFRKSANKNSRNTSVAGRPRKNSEAKLTTPRATTIRRRKKITAPVFDMRLITPRSNWHRWYHWPRTSARRRVHVLLASLLLLPRGQTNHAIIIRRRAAAAITIAGEQIERSIRPFDDVTKTAKLPREVTIEPDCFVRIGRIE